MKKLIAILLAAIMLLSIAGCGKKEPASDIFTFDDVDTEAAAEEKEEKEDESEEAEFELGVITENTYENSFIGYGLKISDDWTFYNKAQINQLNGLVADMVDDEQLKEQLKNSSVIYDMYAASSDGLQTMNVTLENIGAFYASLMTEDDYIDNSLKTLPSILVSAGYSEDMEIEKVTVNFAGRERNGVKIKASIYGKEIYQLMMVTKAGNYMVLCTLTSFVTDNTEELAGWFYAVN